MMKTVLAGAALVLAGLATPPAAHAQQSDGGRYKPISGETLIRLCTAQDPSRVRECTAYIDGAAETLVDYQAARPADGSKGQPLPAYVCVPGNAANPIQLRNAVVSWARQNRDALQGKASVLVIHALLGAFPCRS